MGAARLGALVVCAIVGWSVAAGVAAAHDDLVAATPADGQSVSTPPSEVELEFDGDLTVIGDRSVVVVTAADDRVVSVGPTEIDGPYARQPLADDLADGEYQVAYRVVSSDGHVVTGTTRFFVGPVPAATSQTAEAEDAAASGPGSALPGVAVVVGGVAVVVGALLMLRRGRSERGLP